MAATLTAPATDLAAQWREIADEVEPKLLDLMRRGDYLGLQEVEAFEAEWAAYVGAPHAVACSSGTDAVELMVRACTEPSASVSVPSKTFVATLAAVERSGRTSLINSIDYADARIAVWLYGSTANAESVRRDCAERGIMLLEDASQAHGNPVAGKVGVAAAWSCYPSKNLGAAGMAGIVTFHDSVAAAKARRIREHGYDRATDRHWSRGFNLRMDGCQAVVLRAKLKRLDAWVARKREIAETYIRAFIPLSESIEGLPTRRPMPIVAEQALTTENFLPERHHCFHQFVVRVRRERRDSVLASLRSAGIGAMVHYRTTADGRESEWSRSCLSLPIHPHLTDEQVEYVVEHVKRAVMGEP